MRRLFSRRSRRNRPERNFVPPAQRDEEPIVTAEQMIRSWSIRTTRLCLLDADRGGDRLADRPSHVQARSLTAEVADRHPGTALEAYSANLKDLFEKELLADVTFRVGLAEVRAHRCVVAARCSPLLDVLAGSAADEEIDLSDTPVGRHPHLLRHVVARCYGVRSPQGSASVVTDPELIEALGVDFHVDLDPRSVVRDLEKISGPKDENDKLYKAAPPDVAIVGRAASAGPDDAAEEWRVEVHAAILCAHSEYARSFFTHGWNSDGGEGEQASKAMRTLRFDPTHFMEDAIEELVLACYACNLFVCDEPIESFLQLLDGATYLGMDMVSLLCEEALASRITAENLPEMLSYSVMAGSRLLPLECHKFICRNLGALEDAGSLPRLSYEQMKDMLLSEFVESPEEDILGAVLQWSDESSDVSHKQLVELISKVRIPVVPVDSPILARSLERGLVTDEQMRVCRLFQTDSDFRTTMIGSGDSMYRLRMGKLQQGQIRQQERRLQEIELERLESLRGFAVMRMLGTVNGRNSFDKIRSIRFNDDCDGLSCEFPASVATESPKSFNIPFSFNELETPHKPSREDREQVIIDRSVLQSMPLEDVERLTAKMLTCEEELRLHPRVQAVYGLIGEDEVEMSRFTTALQSFVAAEFNVDPTVGVELIRSAATLFPDTAQIVHYVRHNRCFRGQLKVGDEAPDVAVSTLEGDSTTLWNEIEKRRSSRDANSGRGPAGNGPVVILGASYT